MTRNDKGQLIIDLTEKFKDNNHFYITDTSGLSVAEINKFRGMCYKEGVEYKVFKNTFIKRALDNFDTDYSSMQATLKGFSGVMFVKENGKAPAKIIQKYRKEDVDGRPYFKAASINTDIFIGEDQLATLSVLKSKTELIGEIITLLQSPATNVISALQSGGGKLAGIMKTLSERQ